MTLDDILAWLVILSILGSLILNFRARRMVGDRALMNDAFAAPGAVYYQTEMHGKYHHYLIEHAIVSIESHDLPTFEIALKVEVRLSKDRLDGYSERLFNEVFESHRPLMGALSFPENWGRPEKTAVLVALSTVPVHQGRLECRRGKLVLKMERIIQEGMPSVPPEDLLRNTKTMLENLARTLSEAKQSQGAG